MDATHIIIFFYVGAVDFLLLSELTKRAIWFTMINNTDAAQPQITVKRDGVLKEFEIDTVIAAENLAAELKKRNVESAAAHPIKVQFEYKYCWNLSLIETPGFTKSTKVCFSHADDVLNTTTV